MKPSRLLKITACTMLVLATGLIGCQYLGWAMENTIPSPVKAQHTPEDVQTIVLVDDPKQLLTTPQMMDQIAGRIGEDLIKNNVLSEDRLIDPGKVSQARINHTDFGEWYVEDIADHVGAEQVIHVQVVDFHLGKLDDEYRPAAKVHVKVWDIPKRERTFPKSEAPRDFAIRVARLRRRRPLPRAAHHAQRH